MNANAALETLAELRRLSDRAVREVSDSGLVAQLGDAARARGATGHGAAGRA
jgi:hypothetical protein